MLIRFAEIYEKTDILSPIDRKTWQIVAETCGLGPGSRLLELASGKGAFATYVARKFGCHIDCYDANTEFVQYATNRAGELGLTSKITFANRDVNSLEVKPDFYDAGVCLGALYIFRDAGWKLLMSGVKPGAYLAVSDLYCKRVPAPSEVKDVFFEEEDQPLTLEDARHWYTTRGVKILREEECSRKAWLDYYDLTKKMLLQLAEKYQSDEAIQVEIKEGLREDRLVREFGEEYFGYRTFILRKL